MTHYFMKFEGDRGASRRAGSTLSEALTICRKIEAFESRSRIMEVRSDTSHCVWFPERDENGKIQYLTKG